MKCLDKDAKIILDEAANSNYNKEKEAELIETMILNLAYVAPAHKKHRRLYARDTDLKYAKNISKVLDTLHSRRADD